MTNQERPVETHEDLLNTSASVAPVAIAEQEPVEQNDIAAEAQADLPEQEHVAAADALPVESVAEAQTESPDQEQAVDAPPVAVTPAAEEAPAVTPEVHAAVEPEAEAPQTEALVAEAARAEELVVEDRTVETTPETTTPVASTASESETVDSSVSEGASYTPVDEDASGKPRRVKDLEVGMELEGRVTSIALYGIFVDIGVGRDGLVHISEMSDTRIESPSDVVQIGDTVKVRVKSVEPDGKRISLTMRSKERNENRSRPKKKPDLNREALATLRVGDVVEGTVTGIAPFGVFVDIGVGKDGLVHISELSEGRIDKAEDAVEVGQTYTFKLLEVDAEGTRISLSLRRAQRAQRMQQLEPGQILEGTVSGLAPFGAFIDIGVGRDGLVHISELSYDRVNKVEDVVKVGDPVKARVLEVDPQSKRISLTLRIEDRPRETSVGRTAPTDSDTPREEPRARREEPRGRREDRPERPARSTSSVSYAEPSVDTNETDDESGDSGNATLEDLLSKYGNGGRRDKRRRRDEEEDEEPTDRNSRRQRDAIRRTIQQLRDDE
jgi:predicted RNA-binding protein with RPS1 domain